MLHLCTHGMAGKTMAVCSYRFCRTSGKKDATDCGGRTFQMARGDRNATQNHGRDDHLRVKEKFCYAWLNRTIGLPKFTSGEFQIFMKANEIKYSLHAPYHIAFNGLAK